MEYNLIKIGKNLLSFDSNFFFAKEGKIIVPEKHLYEIFNYVQLYEILGEIAFFGRERKKFQSY